jgi:hypothetical protein
MNPGTKTTTKTTKRRRAHGGEYRIVYSITKGDDKGKILSRMCASHQASCYKDGEADPILCLSATVEGMKEFVRLADTIPGAYQSYGVACIIHEPTRSVVHTFTF